MAINFLAWSEAICLRGGAAALEHPEDAGVDPFPSLFDTAEQLEWEKKIGAVRANFDQCMCGGPTRKGTTISGTLEGLSELDGLRCDGNHAHERSVGIHEGVHLTRRLQSYPAGLCQVLAACIIATLRRFAADGSGPTGWKRTALPTARISAWSTTPSASRPCGVALLNETAVRGRGVVVQDMQAAVYMHVDNGLVLADGILNCLFHDKIWILAGFDGVVAVGLVIEMSDRDRIWW